MCLFSLLVITKQTLNGLFTIFLWSIKMVFQKEQFYDVLSDTEVVLYYACLNVNKSQSNW